MSYNPTTTNYSNEDYVDAKCAANPQPKISDANCAKMTKDDRKINNYPESRIDDLYAHLCEVYHQKNHDYGNSFEDGLNEDGLIFAKMHLMEKYNRFKMLIKEPNKVKNEGIRDSLLDMANYAIMTVYWMDNHTQQTL